MSLMTGYRKPATDRIFPAGMNYLADLIVRPGIEKTFGPLLLYRGRTNRGQAHRMWNMVLNMMACEAETIADGLKIVNNPALSQLCGPVKTPQKLTLHTFLTRLEDNPSVTKQIRGLTDYVRSLEAGPCVLQRVDRFSDRRFCAEWRKSVHPEAGEEASDRGIARSRELFYPYMVRDPKKPDDGEALVKLVNAAVPDRVPEHIRADACQEMVVGLLSGDISVGELHDKAQEYIRHRWREYGKFMDGAGPRVSGDDPLHKSDGTPFESAFGFLI